MMGVLLFRNAFDESTADSASVVTIHVSDKIKVRSVDGMGK